MSVIGITKENFQSQVLESEKTVLLDFWADWCGPCRMVAPVLEEIAAEEPNIKVCKVNVDEEPDLAAQYRIRTIPTLMVIKNGQVAHRSAGAKSKARILAMLQ